MKVFFTYLCKASRNLLDNGCEASVTVHTEPVPHKHYDPYTVSCVVVEQDAHEKIVEAAREALAMYHDINPPGGYQGVADQLEDAIRDNGG